jgi:hypothetical protein
MTGCYGKHSRARYWVALAALVLLCSLVVGPPGAAAQAVDPSVASHSANANPANASQEPPTPQVSTHAPVPITQVSTTASPALAAPQAATLSLPPLSAVLIVGPIDGDNGSWTNDEKANMDLAANELAANGVTVHKFYAPNTDWDQIKAAAAGAQFIFYRGHGIDWGNGVFGGFALSNGKLVSSDDIRSGLHPAPGAIVMMYGCYTAGSSGSDETTAISSAEAQKRVALYSDPFFDVGASAYLADWYGDAFQLYVRYLFQGQTLGQAYKSYFDYNASSVETYNHPDHPDMAMWLDKDVWGHLVYNDAFAGYPNKTLTDLFGAKMSLSPTTAGVLAQVGGAPRTLQIRVGSAQGAALNWATVNPPSNEWIRTSPASGNNSQPLLLTLTPGSKGVGTYTASVRIQSTTAGVQNGDQTVPVTLKIVSRLFHVYLPITRQ